MSRYSVVEVPSMFGAPTFTVRDGLIGEIVTGSTPWKDEAEKTMRTLEYQEKYAGEMPIGTFGGYDE